MSKHVPPGACNRLLHEEGGGPQASGMKRSLCLIMAWLGLACLGHAEDIALYDGGTITAEDVKAYAEVSAFPMQDPLAVLRGTKDAGVAQEADHFVNLAVNMLFWNRQVADAARKEGFALPATLAREVSGVANKCAADEWKRVEREKITTPTMEQLLETFRRNRASYERPEMREISYIFRAVDTASPQADRDSALSEMQALRASIVAGKTGFADAARLHSEAPSAKDGGRIPLVSRSDRYNRLFTDLVFETAPGTVSDARMLHNGVYLVRVSAVVPETRISEADIGTSEALRQRLQGQYVMEQLAAAVDRVRSSAPAGASEAEALAADARAMGHIPGACARKARMQEDRLLAREYFTARNQTEWAPSEAQIRDYYTSHPGQMMEDGMWRLTKFVVPVSGKPGAPVRTLAQAREIAARMHADARAGASDEELGRRHRASGVDVRATPEWVRGSGDAGLDQQLLRAGKGELTTVTANAEGAFFVRLDDSRKPTVLPLEQKRDYIIGVLTALNSTAAADADRERRAGELHLRKLWREAK
jgi:hypothetical protein